MAVAPPARRSSYLFLVAIVAMLCLAGLVMVLSASSVASLRSFGTPWWLLRAPGHVPVHGAVAFFAAQGIRITFWQRMARPLMFLAGAALLAVLVAGRSAGGASRWLGTGSFQFQPSELAKLALVLFAADVLARREGKRDWVYRTVPVLVVMSAFVVLIMKPARHGDGRRRLLCRRRRAFCRRDAGADDGAAGGCSAASAGSSWPLRPVTEPPGSRRSSTPSRTPAPPATNPSKALIALGGGHWIGTGIGQSLASWGYLPNQYTDFIFAVIGQETGFAGSVVVLGLFAAIAVVGTQVAWRPRPLSRACWPRA